MLKRLHVITVLLCVSSSLQAGTAPIGSAVTQGDMQIDHYAVKTTGTIFDGSVIQTGASVQSHADVRLGSDAKVSLHNASSGTMYRDHFVLLSGAADLSASPAFHMEVNGLVVRSSDLHSDALISIGPDGTVNVQAHEGSLQVAKDGGTLLTQVSPEQPLTFRHADNGGWQFGGSSPWFDRDHHCYVDGGDYDRDGHDCGGHHHHHHPSK